MQIFVMSLTRKVCFCCEIYTAFASIVLLQVGIRGTLTFVLHCPHNMVVLFYIAAKYVLQQQPPLCPALLAFALICRFHIKSSWAARVLLNGCCCVRMLIWCGIKHGNASMLALLLCNLPFWRPKVRAFVQSVGRFRLWWFACAAFLLALCTCLRHILACTVYLFTLCACLHGMLEACYTLIYFHNRYSAYFSWSFRYRRQA